VKARKSDLVALGFLIAAVVAFGLYQGLVETRIYDPSMGPDVMLEESRGYQVWSLIYEAQKAGSLDAYDLFLVAGLILGVFVTLIAPPLVNVLGRSRSLWWTGVCSSAMAVIGVCGGTLWLRYWINWYPAPDYEDGPGFYFLLSFPVLNFIGLLCIRKRSGEVASESFPQEI
jgi:hypothetical protein